MEVGVTVPNSEPIISIIIPVYQAERFLTQCLDSVLAQTLTNFEVICIDDGSTDGSGVILDEFAERDGRILAVHQQNQGAGVSRNRGLAMARGMYTIFLDCDDYFEPTLLAELYEAIEREQADVAICRSICFDDATGKQLPSEWMRKDHFLKGKTAFAPQEMGDCLFQFTYGWAWDKLFRTEFLRSGGFTFPVLRNSEDLVFVYPAISMAKRIVAIDDPLIYYRMNRKTSVSHSRKQVPTAPWAGMQMFEAELKKRELYSIFEQSFLNWAMEFLVWNVSNIPEIKTQKQEFLRLKSELFPYYQFDTRSRSYYFNGFTYSKYLLVQHGNWMLFSAVIHSYHWIKAICTAIIPSKRGA